MQKRDADAWIDAAEKRCGRLVCWVAPESPDTRHVFVDGFKLTIRKYAYGLYRGRGHDLGGPEYRERLVNICGNRDCVSPFHHVPSSVRSRRQREERRRKEASRYVLFLLYLKKMRELERAAMGLPPRPEEASA